MFACTTKYYALPLIAIPPSWENPSERYLQLKDPIKAQGDFLIISKEDFKRIIINQSTCDEIRKGLIDIIHQLQPKEEEDPPAILPLTTADNT